MTVSASGQPSGDIAVADVVEVGAVEDRIRQVDAFEVRLLRARVRRDGKERTGSARQIRTHAERGSRFLATVSQALAVYAVVVDQSR